MSVTQKSAGQFGISPAIFERIGGNGKCFCPLKEDESGENACFPHFPEGNSDMGVTKLYSCPAQPEPALFVHLKSCPGWFDRAPFGKVMGVKQRYSMAVPGTCPDIPIQVFS